MVSRIEFFCPGCGAPEVPELILREYYHCPNCEVVTPREELDRQRRNNYVLAGANLSQFTVTNLGVWSGGDSLTTVFACPYTVKLTSGEMFIACVGTSASTSGTIAALGSDALTSDVDSVAGEVCILHFAGTLTNPGLQTLTVTFASPPADFGVCMLKVTGQASSSPVDKTKANAGAASPNFTTGLTTGNLAVSPNELAIGMTTHDIGTETFKSSFILSQRVDQGSTSVAQAVRQLSSIVAIRCDGTEPGGISNQNAAALITIKPR